MTEDLSAAAEEKIRVLIIGETPLIRAGLEASLSDSPNFEVVGATNLAASATLFETTHAAAALMDRTAFDSWNGPDSLAASESDTVVTPPATPLTPREIEVLRLLAGGTSNKMIAHTLGISDHTVKFHVTSILSKLSAGSRTEAVTIGVRLGLVYL